MMRLNRDNIVSGEIFCQPLNKAKIRNVHVS